MRLKIPSINVDLTLAFHPPFDVSTPEGRSLERKRRIALTALTSIIVKVLSMAIPLITLKITFSYLGVEIYGLWSTVSTFFALFSFSDLGLGNGLNTKLSQANGNGDINVCSNIISNTYTLLWCIASIFLLAFLAIFWFVDWPHIMNANNPETISIAASVVAILVIPRIFSIPVAIISRTQYALQEGFRSDIWSIVAYLINLFAVFLVAHFDLGKLNLLIATSSINLFVSALNMFVYFKIQRPELNLNFPSFDGGLSKELLSLGILFFCLAVLKTIGLSMDTYIVGKRCNLEDAASFSVILRIALIGVSVVSVFATPLWAANGEAIARGEMLWVKKNTIRMSIIMGLLSLVGGIVILCFAGPFLRFWLGDDFVFSFHALFWMCLLQIEFAFISPWFMVLNAYGKIIPQILIYCIFTPVVFLLKYYLVRIIGIWAVPMCSAIIYLVIVLPFILVYSNKLLHSCDNHM